MRPLWMMLLLGLMAALPTRAEQRSMEVNGITLSYQVHGEGEPLVLLHGFGGCGDMWSDFMPALSARYQLIIPDLRGHGGSTNPSGRFTMRDSATDLLALLDALKLPRVRAMGVSAGGMTLLHAATREPARFEALVLIGATTYFPAQAREILAGVPDSVPPPVMDLFRACATRGQPQVDELMRQFNGLKDSYEDMTFTAPHLGTITARTLVVHGDRDEFFPVQIAADLYAAVPGAALWIVPEGDHVPIFDERQPEFERITLAWLATPAPD